MFFYCVHLAKLDNGNSLGVKHTIQCVRADVLIIAPYVLSAHQTAVVRHWAMGMASAPHPRPMGFLGSQVFMEIVFTQLSFTLCARTQRTKTQKKLKKMLI